MRRNYCVEGEGSGRRKGKICGNNAWIMRELLPLLYIKIFIMEDGGRDKIDAIQGILSQVIHRVGAHLNPEGVRDQFRKLKAEGLWGYIRTRFLQPIKISYRIATDLDILEERDFPIALDTFGSFSILTAYLPSLGIVDREDLYAYDAVGARILVPPQSTKMFYTFSERVDQKLFPRDLFQRAVPGFMPIAAFTPPIYDERGSKLSLLGVIEFREGEKRVVQEFIFNEGQNETQKGGLFISTQGDVQILDSSKMMDVYQERKGLGDGYLLNASWYMSSDNYEQVLDILREEHRIHQFHKFNAVGKLVYEDGNEQVFFVDCFSTVFLPVIGELANRMTQLSGAVGWKLAGVEFHGGGIEFIRNIQLLEAMGVERSKINDTRASFVWDNKQLFNFLLPPDRADMFEIFLPEIKE
jgi:hypothetical protein